MGLVFHLARAVAPAMEAHVAAAWPNEACGLLLGAVEGGCVRVLAAVPCANVASDPARKFEIDPAALIAAHRAAREGTGARVVGCFHSHPVGGAFPSARDVAAAAGDGAIWAIVAPACGAVRHLSTEQPSDWRIGWWQSSRNGFEHLSPREDAV
ncbi:Mov34/MPN/PAD-1 family protein [Novosphingobium ovatum]|nr:M67 family metallopeptidase [Novosphingobium ovatum]